MIGKAYWAIFQYYDGKLNKMAFKKRPVLIIGKADEKDWVVLPISRVTRREYLNSHYDFEMDVLSYPKMSLKQTSYVRTHKQAILNEGELSTCITDFRSEYQDAYIEIMALVEEFQKDLINKAI